MDSVRRRRRGRLVRPACADAGSVLGFAWNFFGIVLIFFVAYAPEKVAGTTRGTESTARSLEGVIAAEILSAHQTALEKRLGGRVSANETAAFIKRSFHDRQARNFQRLNAFSISCLAEWRCSSDGQSGRLISARSVVRLHSPPPFSRSGAPSASSVRLRPLGPHDEGARRKDDVAIELRRRAGVVGVAAELAVTTG